MQMMLTVLRARLLTTLALTSTALVLLFLLLLGRTQQALLIEDYGLAHTPLVVFYVALLLICVLVFRYEPALRQRALNPRWEQVITVVGIVLTCLIVTRPLVDQPVRAFRPSVFPFIAMHLLFLLCLAHLIFLPTARLGRRFAVALLATLIVLLLVAHVVSVGHFVRFDDLFDELYKVSSATNYAYHGLISPSFSASPFGSPDPSAARYYVIMGLWIRVLGDSSFVTLRTFPLLVGLVAVMLTAVALWRSPSLTFIQRLGGILTLLALATFVRMSHNLRNDIGLAVCGALVLLCLLEMFRSKRRASLWAFASGLALWVGMENIPTITLILGVVVGVALIGYAWAADGRRFHWQLVAGYAGGAAMACTSYALVHYGADVQGSLATMREYTRVYIENDSVPGGAWERIPGFFRSSLMFSPAEPLVIVGVLLVLFTRRSKGLRLIAAIPTATVLGMVLLIGGSLGYLVMLSPFIAYAVALALDRPWVRRIGIFVLLPAMAFASTYDMLLTRQQGMNSRDFDSWDAIVPEIPQNVTVIGPNDLWLVLHHGRNYIGWDGLFLNRMRYQDELRQAMARLMPDLLICEQDQPRRCENYAPDVTPYTVETPIDAWLVYDLRR